MKKKNSLTEKCAEALAEAASVHAPASHFAETPRTIPAETKTRAPEISRAAPAKSAPTQRAPEKFSPREESPRKIPASNAAPAPVAKPSPAMSLKNAVSVVPAALSKYLEERFQTKFSRVVSAADARVFSSTGETFAEKSDVAIAPENDVPDDDSDD